MSDPLKLKSKLQILMESFDKKYIEELFKEGDKIGLWPPTTRQNYIYDYQGYRYTLSRVALSVIAQRELEAMMKRAQMFNKGGF